MQLKREIKFETLRKSYKKQIIIGSVLVCVIGSILTFNLTKAKYRLIQSMKLVTGTINYKVPDLRIVALYTENDNNEYVESNNVPTSGYTLNEEKSICRVYDGTTSVAEAPKDEKVNIDYSNGEINITHLTKKNTRCYLYFDKIIIPPEPTDDTLAKLEIDKSKVIEQTDSIPDFSKTATTDEGIFKVEDGMYGGYSYYWRGASTTNHLIFANKCWRIIRINGDGTIRLIYNGATSNNTCTGNGSNSGSIAVTNQVYNGEFTNSEHTGYTYTTGKQRPEEISSTSALKESTDTWYNNNLGNNATHAAKVANGKFCNDRNVKTGNMWNSTDTSFIYAARERLESAKILTLSCSTEDVYSLKAGAITADEVAFAGGVYGTSNSSYYLYNEQCYWTMSPNSYDSSWASSVFAVWSEGNLESTYVFNGDIVGNRPVINLRSDVEFNSGSDGTQNNPYIVQ